MTRAKRIRRWLWNGAVVVSLVMMVGVGTALAASHWRFLWVSRTQSSVESTANPALNQKLKVHRGAVLDQGDLRFSHSTEVEYVESVNGTRPATVRWDYGVEPLGEGATWRSEFDFVMPGIRVCSTVMWTSDVVLGGGTLKIRWIAISLPYALTVFSVLPTIWLILWYRRHPKRLPGHCSQCGYNLIGTLAANRTECPECGAPVNAREGTPQAAREAER